MLRIKPVTVDFQVEANRIKIIVSYTLGSTEDIRFRIEFYSDSDIKTVKDIHIPSTQVPDWGLDDTPVVDFILQYLGLEKEEVPTIPMKGL